VVLDLLFQGFPGSEADFRRQKEALDSRERKLVDMQANLQSEIKRLNEENRNILEKAKELEERESDLHLQSLELETKTREVRASGTTPGMKDMGREAQLEEWERRLREREEELKRRSYQKEKEMEMREGAIKARITTAAGKDEAEEAVAVEKKADRVKTGTPRLDDLLYGGIPFNSNVLFVGPAFVGKEVGVLNFIAEGLKKGIPGIIITTAKLPIDIAKDIAPIFQAKCQECHEPGSIAPMSLITYQDVRPWARSIKERVATRQMPPWHIDKSVGVPIKARDADVYVFTLSRFEEFPNLWTSSGTFTDMKKISDANPQQSQYNWGHSELIEYVNADGKTLKAILTKPEDFDPSKKYPLLVYIYEQLSNNLYRYVPPAPGGSSINVTRYVSNGYIVLQPDIVYDIGYPGDSALKCVLPATQKVISMGFIDPKRVGIQGHSWGGYQITYMITRTNMFRAVEAGASVVDMAGGYGGIRWGTGMSRAFQYEKSQSRIGVPPWENPKLYLENSPIYWIDKIKTPYLTMANDEDDAVPWQQGIQFFTAMRRLGKEAYMFTYNGEKHGLRQRENQKHWTVHLAEYFDYFLKDAPKPDWMEHGVPYLEKGKRDVTPLFKKSTDGQEPQ